MSARETSHPPPRLSAKGERARRLREERLARQLRANLRRRKAQLRGRGKGAGGSGAGSSEPGAGEPEEG